MIFCNLSLVKSNKNMKRNHLLFLILFAISAMLLSFRSNDSLNSYDEEKIKAVIESHEKTMIFVWSDWCGASKLMLDKNIKPNIEGLKENNIGIVIVHYGDNENVTDSVLTDDMLYNIESYGGFIDRKDIHSKLKRLLPNYQKSKFFPIPLLVDNNGNILNFCDGEFRYSYYEIFLAAKGE